MFEINIFEAALSIQTPWYVKEVQFDVDVKRLDIYIDFKRGSTFPSKRSENSDRYNCHEADLDSHRLPLNKK